MLTYRDLSEGLGTRVRNILNPAHLRFNNVVIDSRQVAAGDLFVALRGEKDEGSNYIPQAIQKGATGIITERLPEKKLSGAAAVFLVDDSLAALQDLAEYWRNKHNVVVIGITGSVGKTSVKEVVASILSRRYKVLKNEGNLNNEIGLPLTLLKLDKSHQRVVLEMGTYGIGEIRTLCNIARPQIGIVTNVGPTHLERMGSLETITEAKSELVESLPQNGVAILNGDDERVKGMSSLSQAPVILYGLDPSFDIWASEIESSGLEGIRFRLNRQGESTFIKVPLLGAHSVHTVLAATAVALNQGLYWEDIVAGLCDTNMQLRILVVPGINDSTIIDDSYNASPISTIAALNLLAEMDGRKIAVLGDMLELGDMEIEGHQKVGRRAADVVNRLIVVGEKARIIGEEAATCGLRGVEFANSNEEAGEKLLEWLSPGDYVLIKGSRGTAMEQIVDRIRR